jgi:signal transduction histidine kinase
MDPSEEDELLRSAALQNTRTILAARKRAEEELIRAKDDLERRARELEVLYKTGMALSSKLDTKALLQTLTDAATEVTRAQFGAFFYNTRDESGQAYMLYTLSGAPREAFASFPMPRATALFGPTFRGEGVVRCDDVKTDARYGLSAPYHGMPPGHLPVRSYLAVPVVSRAGAIHGGLFFGHAEPGIFTERDEVLVGSMAAQAAIAIDNARLFENLERSRLELQQTNETLEQRVHERTERLREMQEQLHQAQKMEAIGQLTGGVAHDFNNLLTVILGNLDLLTQQIPPEQGRLHRAATQALLGTRRAATLTHQLLAFSRRQPLDPKPTDVNRLVTGMSELLRRTLGETISIETVLSAGLWRVEVDANQLESGLLNLAINARDAMPNGGKLTIETANAHLDESYSRLFAEVRPGQYVAICVSDTGAGMSADVLARAFEPFFSTKPVGAGTGLGLSQVYGFVKQSGGHIRLYSEIGEGTTVKVYLPRLLGAEAAATDSGSFAAVPRGELSETILVVEDDDNVRQYSVEALHDLGYRVLPASSAAMALNLLHGHPEIQLLFTDVGLPGVNGRELADAAREHCPGLKVLFTTGYARNAIVHQGRLDAGVELLTKPFTRAQLATRIRDVLDSPRS